MDDGPEGQRGNGDHQGLDHRAHPGPRGHRLGRPGRPDDGVHHLVGQLGRPGTRRDLDGQQRDQRHEEQPPAAPRADHGKGEHNERQDEDEGRRRGRQPALPRRSGHGPGEAGVRVAVVQPEPQPLVLPPQGRRHRAARQKLQGRVRREHGEGGPDDRAQPVDGFALRPAGSARGPPRPAPPPTPGPPRPPGRHQDRRKGRGPPRSGAGDAPPPGAPRGAGPGGRTPAPGPAAGGEATGQRAAARGRPGGRRTSPRRRPPRSGFPRAPPGRPALVRGPPPAGGRAAPPPGSPPARRGAAPRLLIPRSRPVLSQNASSARSIRALSVASAMARCALSCGSTCAAKNRAAATLPS